MYKNYEDQIYSGCIACDLSVWYGWEYINASPRYAVMDLPFLPLFPEYKYWNEYKIIIEPKICELYFVRAYFVKIIIITFHYSKQLF